MAAKKRIRSKRRSARKPIQPPHIFPKEGIDLSKAARAKSKPKADRDAKGRFLSKAAQKDVAAFPELKKLAKQRHAAKVYQAKQRTQAIRKGRAKGGKKRSLGQVAPRSPKSKAALRRSSEALEKLAQGKLPRADLRNAFHDPLNQQRPIQTYVWRFQGFDGEQAVYDLLDQAVQISRSQDPSIVARVAMAIGTGKDTHWSGTPTDRPIIVEQKFRELLELKYTKQYLEEQEEDAVWFDVVLITREVLQ